MILAGSIAVIGVEAHILGKNADTVLVGSVALLIMGVGVAAFGAAMAIAFPAINNNGGLESALIFAGSIAAIGIEAAILGQFATNVILGSVALLVLGASTMTFGLGLAVAMPAIHNNGGLESAGILAGSIAMIGAEAIALGIPVVAGFALLGSTVIMSMGAAMIIYGTSMSIAMAAAKNVDKEKIEDLSETIVALGKSFAACGTPGKSMGPARILAGAGAMSLAGLALISIATSLRIFAGIMGDIELGTFDSNDPTKSTGLLADVYMATSMIGNVFAQIANEGGQIKKGGLLGFVTGTKSAIKEGIDSVIGTTKALTRIASGIRIFNAITKTIPIGKFNEDDPSKSSGLLGDIYMTCIMIGNVFAKLGSTENQVKRGGLIGAIIGNKNAVKIGIDSVKNTNTALTSIANGIKSYNDIAGKIDVGTFNEKTPEKSTGLLRNVYMTTAMLSNVFSMMGSGKKTKFGGILSSIITDKIEYKRGIEIAQASSDALMKIGIGLKDFQSVMDRVELGEIPESLDKINDAKPGILLNLYKVLMAVPKIYEQIGIGDGANGSSKAEYVNQGIAFVTNVANNIDGIKNMIKSLNSGEWDKIGTDWVAHSEGLATAIVESCKVFHKAAMSIPEEDRIYSSAEEARNSTSRSLFGYGKNDAERDYYNQS